MKYRLFILAVVFTTMHIACTSGDTQKQTGMKTSTGKVELFSPDSLHKNPAFSQVAIAEGPNRTVYVGGQNAVDKQGNIVGKGNIEAQAKQVLSNIERALAAGGASIENIIKWNVYVVQGQPLEGAFKVFQPAIAKMKSPPLITMVYVAALANPDYLMEMDAVAVVPK